MVNPKEDCCGEGTTSKKKKSFSDLKRIFGFEDIKNPIPAEIKDPKEFRQTFGKNAFIPYAGADNYSSHGLLNWLNSMRFLSPTHGSCIESIKSYAFPGYLDIVKVPHLSLDLGIGFDPEEVSTDSKKSFAEFIAENVDLGNHKSLLEIIHSNYDSYSDNGNYWLEVVNVDVGGVKKSSIHYHPAETVCYFATDNKQPRVAGISLSWDYNYIQENPPRQVPVYPYVKESNGVQRTLIHIKNGNYIWYGRPAWMSSFMYVYREFQDANYLIKQAANNFIGQIFIEIEDADPESNSIQGENEAAQEAGFDNVADRVRQNFTAQADKPQTVMMTNRPHGARPAFVYQFKPNTSEQFYKVSAEIAEMKIIRAHQWSKRFLGENQTQGFSANVFIDELKVKETGVLAAHRMKASEGLNLALDLIIKFHGLSEFENFGVYGKNNFDNLKKYLTEDELGDTSKTPTQELTDSLGGDQV